MATPWSMTTHFLTIPLVVLCACAPLVVEPNPQRERPSDGDRTTDAAIMNDASAVDLLSIPDTPVATDVVPTDTVTEDVAPAFSACGEATLTSTPVEAAEIERANGGYVAVWYPSGSNDVHAQALTETLAPRGAVLTVPLNLTNGTGGTLSLAFSGSAGAIATGSSIVVLSLAPDGTLSIAGRYDYPRRLLRGVRLAHDTGYHAVLADGAFVRIAGDRMSANTPNAALSPPHSPGMSFVFDTRGGGYRSFDPVNESGTGQLLVRRFIFGHGAVLAAGNTTSEGASVSPVVASSSSLYRLMATGTRELDVSLERRDPSTGAVVGAPVSMQRGAAWHATTGAIDASGDVLFATWAAKPRFGGYNNTLRVAWGADTPSVEVYVNREERVVQVFDAVCDARCTQGWALFGERMSERGFSLRARCVARSR